MKRAWVMLLFTGACATMTPAKPGPEPASYWPLKSGQVLNFDTQTAGGKSQRKVVVKKSKKGWFQVGPGQRLRHDADGLFDGKRYLIRRPLRVGAGWHAIPRPGVIERFKVVRVDTPCPKTFGLKRNCLAIEARQKLPDQVLLTRWWYAEGEGLMQVEVFLQQSSGQLMLQSRLRRKGAL